VEGLLKLSRAIDYVNDRFGELANWLVLLACLISAGNAASRYMFSASSNAWLEVQWYMFAVIVMFGAAYTLKRNEHVRVDIFYMTLTRRGQLWIDILGTLVFLLPTCIILAWLSWPFFAQSTSCKGTFVPAAIFTGWWERLSERYFLTNTPAVMRATTIIAMLATSSIFL